MEGNTDDQMENDVQDTYAENDPDIIGPGNSRRSSDLDSPELNWKAQKTAQEVDLRDRGCAPPSVIIFYSFQPGLR